MSLQRYLQQLHEDIALATRRLNGDYAHLHQHFRQWVSEAEEEATAPVRELEDWTGITLDMLPPEQMLDDAAVHALLEALKTLLDACNWVAVLQTTVPERVEYSAIRAAWRQSIRIKRWHMGFFAWCAPGTPQGSCALGEHCQCAWYEALQARFTDHP
ncbi:hypothetical protein SAMN05444008_101398 [Cnuella takakiae]|uniref:Uncharacterized protein n=1 Tax=Cnuella takakiae TaxID=1302690 RepID=A0A1M4TF43_9BACT|nr:hypothetical protein [Cnuella takakiae]OLY90725.1 hypothetical protein BUE76_01540 [Cnuella takakiae]SHE43112.1 hypothetical protein SAMN05444008_101398 [Cnuella takakiae]